MRRIDVGEVNGRRFLGIASCGFDSDANRIANEAELVHGDLVYVYAGVRALLAWRPARFTVTVDGERHEITGYTVAAANTRLTAEGCSLRPDALLNDGELDVVMTGRVGKLRFLANLPKVFKGTHVEDDAVTVVRGAEVRIEADREFAVYADGDHLADTPATVRVLDQALGVIAPAIAPGVSAGAEGRPRRSALFGPKQALARATGAVSRRSGRGGGTTLPGRVLLRLAPDALGRLARSLTDGSTIVSATNGKTTTAGMLASILHAAGRDPVHNRAGSNMSWGVATALLEERDGRTEGLFEVDEAWLPAVAAALEPAHGRARKPVPGPARPLRRAGAARRRLGGASRGARQQRPTSCSTRTIRSSPTRARRGGRAAAEG